MKNPLYIVILNGMDEVGQVGYITPDYLDPGFFLLAELFFNRVKCSYNRKAYYAAPKHELSDLYTSLLPVQTEFMLDMENIRGHVRSS